MTTKLTLVLEKGYTSSTQPYPRQYRIKSTKEGWRFSTENGDCLLDLGQGLSEQTVGIARPQHFKARIKCGRGCQHLPSQRSALLNLKELCPSVIVPRSKRLRAWQFGK